MSGIEADSRFWNSVARKYAADPIKDRAGYERTLERVQALLKPTDAVLEIGCGTGTTALRLAPAVARYLATDFSAGMIAIANEKIVASPVPGLAFSVAAAEADGAEAAFDAVLAFNTLHLLRDRGRIYAAIHHALKPGGLFISKTACLGEMNPLIRLAVPVMQWFGKAPHVGFFTGAALAAEIGAAGFDVAAVERHGTRGKDARVFILARRR